MGWASGQNAQGREVGYSVEAECDQEGCAAEIDRGLSYCCGDMHDGGEQGCGRYFCGEHLHFYCGPLDPVETWEQTVSLCAECIAMHDAAGADWWHTEAGWHARCRTCDGPLILTEYGFDHEGVSDAREHQAWPLDAYSACSAESGWHDDGSPMDCELPAGHDGPHTHWTVAFVRWEPGTRPADDDSAGLRSNG